MADTVDTATRSRMMSGIRGGNTKPEIRLRRLMHAAGFRFRLHRRDLPGSPDIVMPSRRIAIFVHGCFWHSHEACRLAAVPKTRPAFWQNKLEGNRKRDAVAVNNLLETDWRVLVVWECALRSVDDAHLLKTVTKWINGKRSSGEISRQRPQI